MSISRLKVRQATAVENAFDDAGGVEESPDFENQDLLVSDESESSESSPDEGDTEGSNNSPSDGVTYGQQEWNPPDDDDDDEWTSSRGKKKKLVPPVPKRGRGRGRGGSTVHAKRGGRGRGGRGRGKRRRDDEEDPGEAADAAIEAAETNGIQLFFTREQLMNDLIERERVRTLRDTQLERLNALRAEQDRILGARVSTGDIDEEATAETRFHFLLQQVDVTTNLHARLGREATASAASRRLSAKEKAEDLDSPTDLMVGRLTETPSFVTGGSLHAYQLEGVNWLIRHHDAGVNVILADEMGLGKTLQTITLLAYMKFVRNIPGPHLVLCPLSVTQNWVNEVNRWCPELKALKFHGPKEDRPALKMTMPPEPHGAMPYDVVVTTYDTALKEKLFLRRFKWRYLIVDEAHRLKNESSCLSQETRQFDCQSRLLITGTPLQNNLHELWALLNFLFPYLFDSADVFDSWFSVREGTGATNIINQLHRVLRPFVLRRLKDEVLLTSADGLVTAVIPPKKEVYVSCGLTRMQRQWYKDVLAREVTVERQGQLSKARLMNIVQHLRKVCNHPYLFEGAEEGPPFVVGDHIVTNSGKMVILDKLLHKLKAADHRCLVFSTMVRTLDILDDYCRWRGWEYSRIDGNTSPWDREDVMERFNAPGSTVFMCLISTRAGGLGINLHTADTVILYDSDWNPQMDIQAMDRAHRIGQKKPVTVYRFVTTGTIEERVYKRALKKLYLDAVVVQQGRMASSASKDELRSMIRFGVEEIFKATEFVESVTDEDIDRLLEQGAKIQEDITQSTQTSVQMTLATFSLEDESDLFEFEGVNYSTSPTKTVYIDGISSSVTSQMILEAIVPILLSRSSQSAANAKVKISPERTMALVTFHSTDDAIAVVDALGGKELWGCNELGWRFGRKSQALVEGDVAQLVSVHLDELIERKRQRDREQQEKIVAERAAREQAKADAKAAAAAAKAAAAAAASAELEKDENGRPGTPVPKAQPKGPKLPKKPSYPVWQFFNTKRLLELWEKECLFLEKDFERRIRMRETAKAERKKKKLAQLHMRRVASKAREAARKAQYAAKKIAQQQQLLQKNAKKSDDDAPPREDEMDVDGAAPTVESKPSDGVASEKDVTKSEENQADTIVAAPVTPVGEEACLDDMMEGDEEDEDAIIDTLEHGMGATTSAGNAAHFRESDADAMEKSDEEAEEDGDGSPTPPDPNEAAAAEAKTAKTPAVDTNDPWDGAPPLTPEEIEEKRRLEEEDNFKTWSKLDYQNYLRAVEKMGRDDQEGIVEVCKGATDCSLPGKPREEIIRYHDTFWRLGPSAFPGDEWKKIVRRIEKGEALVTKTSGIQGLLEWKVGGLRNRRFDLYLPRVPGPTPFDEFEDRWLLIKAFEVGYKNVEEFAAEVKAVPELRYDWFIQTRRPAELHRRLDTVLRFVERLKIAQEGTGVKQGDSVPMLARNKNKHRPYVRPPTSASHSSSGSAGGLIHHAEDGEGFG